MPSFVHPYPEKNRPVRGGPPSLTSWFVTAVDPTGVIAKPAGTIAFSADGTAAWLNHDGTAAGWVAIDDVAALAAAYAAGARLQNPLTVATVPAGPNVAALDLAIAATADETLIVEIDLIRSAAPGTVGYWRLRLNGAEPLGTGYNVYKEGATLSSEENRSDGTHFPLGFCRDSNPYSLSIEIGRLRSGHRAIRGLYVDTGNATANHEGYVVGSVPTGAIVSVGIQERSGGAEIAPTSTVAAAVRCY